MVGQPLPHDPNGSSTAGLSARIASVPAYLRPLQDERRETTGHGEQTQPIGQDVPSNSIAVWTAL